MAPKGTSVAPERVRLLEHDHELAATIPEEDLPVAKRSIVAPVTRLSPGATDAVGVGAETDSAGLLVLDGLLTRNVVFAGELSRELLGAGDLLRPWDMERDFLPPFSESTWTVLEETTIAFLDPVVLKVGARWPGFVDELLRRALHRSRWLAIRLAISGVNRIDERVLLFFWHAAGRWGRVTSEGILLPFDLTHEVIGELIGAQRPSVTSALTALRKSGKLEIEDGEILLMGEAPGPVSEGAVGPQQPA